MLLVVFTICACSKKEAKPNIELEDENTSAEEVISNIAGSIGNAVNKNNTGEAKPYYFSEDLKNALLNCTPFKEDIYANNPDMKKEAASMLSMFFGEVDSSSFKLFFDVKGKENGKCHVVLQGFHILLNDDELSLSGFDELGKLTADEKRATYSPSYKYQGTLFSLSECEQVSSYNKDRNFGSGNEELSLCDSVKITRGVNSSYKNNACNLSFVLKMTRNGKTEDNSLSCNLTTEQLAQYLKPYSSLLTQYGPKIEASENSFSYRGGQQTAEVSKADQEVFLKMYKAGICKK